MERTELFSQNFEKFVNADYVNKRKRSLLENIVMMVFRYDVAGVGLKCAIHELVIIGVCSNEAQMIVYLYHLRVGQVKDSGYNVRGNLRTNFLSKNFLIFCENLIRDAKCLLPVNEIAPDRIVGATSRERHQQAVGIKNDVHSCLYGVRMCSDFHSSITLSLSIPSSQRRSMASSARFAKYWPSMRRMSSISASEDTLDTISSISIWNGVNGFNATASIQYYILFCITRRNDFHVKPFSSPLRWAVLHTGEPSFHAQTVRSSSAALPARFLLAPKDALPTTGGRCTRETDPECRPKDYSMLLYSYLHLCKCAANIRQIIETSK